MINRKRSEFPKTKLQSRVRARHTGAETLEIQGMKSLNIFHLGGRLFHPLTGENTCVFSTHADGHSEVSQELSKEEPQLDKGAICTSVQSHLHIIYIQ